MSDSSRFIASHVEALPRSGIRDFFAIVSQMPEAISLGIGEPDFITPWHIREATIYALEKGKTSYTDNRGLLSLRKEISTYVENFFGINYNPEDEVLVAVGVSEALDIALRAIINPGDKVMYHQPCFVSYTPCIDLAHGNAIAVPTHSEDQFSINIQALKDSWEPGCKALVLNFPTNPTGGVTDRKKLQDIAAFAVEKDMLVISDEIYAELTFDGEHISIASLPGMKDRTIFLHGFSKAFAMTGFRIGYACAPAPLTDAMMKIHQYGMMCASIISQEAAIEALKNGEESVKKMKDQYHKRRDFVVRRFNEIGLPCHSPKGAFYAFPSIAASQMDDVQFAHNLLKENEVAVVPGSAFGENGKGFIRASFSTSYDRLIKATDRMALFMDKHASQ
jgi:aminotransferase